MSRGRRRKDTTRCPVTCTVVLSADLELLASAQPCVYYTFDAVIKSRWTGGIRATLCNLVNLPENHACFLSWCMRRERFPTKVQARSASRSLPPGP